jgi:hypothetical protein
MPLNKPSLTFSDNTAIQNAKLDKWYIKNDDALYALTVVLYDDLYKYQGLVIKLVPSHTLEEALRICLNGYLAVGVSSLSHTSANSNGFSQGLQDHFNYTQFIKSFRWQTYWAGLLPNQSAIDKLLEVFYNLMICEAVDRGIETDRTNTVRLGQYSALVKAVNNLTKPLDHI